MEAHGASLTPRGCADAISGAAIARLRHWLGAWLCAAEPVGHDCSASERAGPVRRALPLSMIINDRG